MRAIAGMAVASVQSYDGMRLPPPPRRDPNNMYPDLDKVAESHADAQAASDALRDRQSVEELTALTRRLSQRSRRECRDDGPYRRGCPGSPSRGRPLRRSEASPAWRRCA